MVLDTFAVTGGSPKASRTGKVMRVPDPTTVLMPPAATPAPRIARCSSQVIASSFDVPRAPGRAANLQFDSTVSAPRHTTRNRTRSYPPGAAGAKLADIMQRALLLGRRDGV
ncbi:Uncharacterised protein [Mycobacteroides abscessus subsp. abscessus]|nr:Uncharacterised protein [Mycobacteroides abscessus subsp. abscessus]